KTAGEKGILRQPGNPKEEIQPGGFRVFQHPEPFLFVLGKDLFPFIELVPGNAEAFTEGLNGRTVQESFRQDTEDKKEAITGIGDDHIREDGMGMPARSEEHTSELQSRFDLVCRLLLEKKKQKKTKISAADTQTRRKDNY